jgi:hypothetical protein
MGEMKSEWQRRQDADEAAANARANDFALNLSATIVNSIRRELQEQLIKMADGIQKEIPHANCEVTSGRAEMLTAVIKMVDEVVRIEI